MHRKRGSSAETAILFDPTIEPTDFAQHVRAIIHPQSRFIIEEGFMGGLIEFSIGLYLATRIPRATPTIESRIATIALKTFADIENIIKNTMMDYTPLPSYKLADWVFCNATLDAHTRYQAAELLRRWMVQANQQLCAIEAQLLYQDDHLPYDSERIVDALFGAVGRLAVQLNYTAVLLRTARRSLPRIDAQAYAALLTNFNRGVGYLIEACEVPPIEEEGEGSNTIFVNMQTFICHLHRCRQLSPANRAGIERLTCVIAEELLDSVTNPRLSVFVEGVNEDTYRFVAAFAGFAFLDRYVPGLHAEIGRMQQILSEQP